MEFHEVAGIFPMMNEAGLLELSNDIRANGLREPVWIYDGKVIDGRNRFKACQLAGVEPRYQEWNGQGSLIAFVVSLNLHRRHLSESQRAMVAAKLATLKKGSNQHTEISAPSQPEAAKMLSVSTDSVGFARKVQQQGTPELNAAVEAGTVAVSTAAQVATLPETEQRDIVARGKAEIITTANRLRREDKKQAAQARVAQAVEAAKSVVLPPERCRLMCRGIGELSHSIEPESVSAILTDPPYPKEFLPLYLDLAKLAAHALKPGGSLLVMSGQFYLPEVMAMLSEHLNYQWTLALTTPGGQSPQIWPRKVNTFWKPVLWFVKGDYRGGWIGDVIQTNANENDKRFHHWGQNETGFGQLVERFSSPGDWILDPFLGGGTTAQVALEMSRCFVGADNDADAIAITKARLQGALEVAA